MDTSSDSYKLVGIEQRARRPMSYIYRRRMGVASLVAQALVWKLPSVEWRGPAGDVKEGVKQARL